MAPLLAIVLAPLVFTNGVGGPGQLSLVSWNLLAPSFATASKFPWACAHELSWATRQRRIVQTLRTLDADVVCLQEVEFTLWPEFASSVSAIGYDGVRQQTKHTVGNALLLKRGRVECLRTESRSRAMIAVLRRALPNAGESAAQAVAGAGANGVSGGSNGNGLLWGNGGAGGSAGGSNGNRLPPHLGQTVESEMDGAVDLTPLYVANVHLEAGASKFSERQRICQLRSLLRRVELQRAKDVAHGAGRPNALSPSTDVCGAALVLAGDFNFDKKSPQYALLAQGSVGAQAQTLQPQGQRRTQRPQQGQREGQERGQQGQPQRQQEQPPIGDTGAVGGFTHPLLPLRDVYSVSQPPWGPPLRSSYRNGRLLDYVWVSDAVSVLRAMPVAAAAASASPRRVPSAEHPSDHLPVGALISWPGAPPALSDRCAWQQMCVENVVTSATRPRRQRQKSAAEALAARRKSI